MGKSRWPGTDDLRSLPQLAVVEFAARCARRVQPLYKALWPDARPKQVAAVDKAIRLAEAIASARDGRAAGVADATAAVGAANAAALAAGKAAADAAEDAADAAD